MVRLLLLVWCAQSAPDLRLDWTSEPVSLHVTQSGWKRRYEPLQPVRGFKPVGSTLSVNGRAYSFGEDGILKDSKGRKSIDVMAAVRESILDQGSVRDVKLRAKGGMVAGNSLVLFCGQDLYDLSLEPAASLFAIKVPLSGAGSLKPKILRLVNIPDYTHVLEVAVRSGQCIVRSAEPHHGTVINLRAWKEVLPQGAKAIVEFGRDSNLYVERSSKVFRWDFSKSSLRPLGLKQRGSLQAVYSFGNRELLMLSTGLATPSTGLAYEFEPNEGVGMRDLFYCPEIGLVLSVRTSAAASPSFFILDAKTLKLKRLARD